jgi:hypothetical protein
MAVSIEDIKDKFHRVFWFIQNELESLLAQEIGGPTQSAV